jgi:hypothetical protein
MSTKKDRANASPRRSAKPSRRPNASSVEAVELEPLDFDNAEAREKLRTASNLKGTPLARKSRAKRISRAQLIKKIGPNAIFGNMELWGQNFSKLTAIATEPCEVAFLDKRGAEALFDSSSELSLRLLHINGPKLYELELWNYNHLRRKCGLEPIEG